jgi:hypothetical protein
METNGGFVVGSNNKVGWIGWGGVSGCNVIKNKGVVTTQAVIPGTPNLPWPEPIPNPVPSNDPPTAPNTCHSLGPDGTSVTISASWIATHPVGVYCLNALTGQIPPPPPPTLTISGAGGNYSGYTFVAPQIVVSASASMFSPAGGEIITFDATASADQALQVKNATNTITGDMCLGSGGVTLTQNNHPAGAYCLTGSQGSTLTLNGTTWTGYSFYAPNIGVSAGGQTFAAPGGVSGTLFDAYSGNFQANGNNNSMKGNIFAPNGSATLNGTQAAGGSGFIEAQTVTLLGDFSSFIGTGQFGGGIATNPISTIYTTITGTTVANQVVTGTTNPGTTTPNTTIPGTTIPDTTIPGTTIPDTTIRGTTIPDTTIAGSTDAGSTTPDTTVNGVTNPGSTETSTTGDTVGMGE